MNPVWPTPVEEQMLLACFAPDEDASAALERCSRGWAEAKLEAAATPLLPLIYRRWQAVENRVVELGRKAYLANWKRNRERLAEFGGIADRLREKGIRWMALKGMALALRQYADLGLRPMGDVDLLIHAEDLLRAVEVLDGAGYRAEEDAAPDAILRQARVRHAWQFFGGAEWNLDLHWRPVNRCYAPEVTRSFWEGAETVRFGDREMLTPSPSDQMFHVCVHGLQWDWTRKVRWICDALVVLREAVDWERVRQLAEGAGMQFRLANALAFLRESFGAPIPPDLPGRLREAASGWERREYRLLLKPCPLAVGDSIAWHAYHFRRIRPYDDGWRRVNAAVGLAQYFAAFLDARDLRSMVVKIVPHAMLRFRARARE
jgi:hypothetical protein